MLLTRLIEMTTGYGPSHAHTTSRRLNFDGDEDKYEQWEVKFLGYMRLRNLKDVILPSNTAPDKDKNEESFAELIQFLDDKSLQLVMRDAADDGRKALQILRNHYRSSSKPKIISMYTELTSLRKDSKETVTEYLLRAESYSTALKNAGENISDSLLIAMLLKGLPVGFKAFTVVITQSDKEYSFPEFKVALRSFEETEKCNDQVSESVMQSSTTFVKNRITCFNCKKTGHKAYECKSKPFQQNAHANRESRYCNFCRSNTHSDKFCRKRNRDNHAKQANHYEEPEAENLNFTFSINENFGANGNVFDELLVDTGATSHICNDLSKFISFDETFEPENHYIQLADGKASNKVALKRGTVSVRIRSSDNIVHSVNLEDTLYVPSYPQNIFSVRAATKKGCVATFSPKSAQLKAPNNTRFPLKDRNRLYYLNVSADKKCASYDIQKWHEILGHCNVDDIGKLESVVDGMKISAKSQFKCETCIMGKQTQDISRTPDRRASKPLELVHTDLAGPIGPTSNDGFRYAINFVDDFSGTIFVYFLKQKCDAAVALKRFLADSSRFGKVKCLRSDNGGEFTSSDFQEILLQNSISHERSAPYSPHQNGTAERNWRTLFEMARCLLLQSGLPKELWTYAVAMSAYIRNRCFVQRTKQTPFFNFIGKKPNLSNMHVFGTVCYGLEHGQAKLESRSTKGIFVGYDRYSPAFLMFDPSDRKVKKYRCVKFLDVFETKATEIKRTPEEDCEPVSDENAPDCDEDWMTVPQMSNESQNRRYPQRLRSAPNRFIMEDCDNRLLLRDVKY